MTADRHFVNFYCNIRWSLNSTCCLNISGVCICNASNCMKKPPNDSLCIKLEQSMSTNFKKANKLHRTSLQTVMQRRCILLWRVPTDRQDDLLSDCIASSPGSFPLSAREKEPGYEASDCMHGWTLTFSSHLMTAVTKH